MPVHIGSLETEVVSEPRPAAAANDEARTPAWRSLADARALATRIRRDARRTRAEGFDD